MISTETRAGAAGDGISISVWFACKICKHIFHNVENFLKHKIDVHFKELQKLSCIVFEERSVVDNTSGYNFPDSSFLATVIKQESQDLPSDAQHLDLELAIDNKLATEAETETDDSICQVQNKQRHFQQNPYVLLQRLTSKKIQQYNKCQTQAFLPQHLTVVSSKSETRPFKCPRTNCEQALKTRKVLAMHLKTHNLYRSFKCSSANCEKAFKTRSNLLQHLKTHTQGRPFKCLSTNCGKAFKTRWCLESHLKTHTKEKRLKCPLSNCEKAYSIRTSCKGHLEIHTKNKQFKCQEPNCGKAFKRKKNLHGHLEIHSDSRPCFHCPYPSCEIIFRKKYSLKRHCESLHSQDSSASGEKLLEYIKCDRTDCLSTRYKRRLDKGPMKCPQPNCTKKFQYESKFREHLASHSSVKSYKCSVPINCGKEFKYPCTLNEHVKTHTTETKLNAPRKP